MRGAHAPLQQVAIRLVPRPRVCHTRASCLCGEGVRSYTIVTLRDDPEEVVRLNEAVVICGCPDGQYLVFVKPR